MWMSEVLTQPKEESRDSKSFSTTVFKSRSDSLFMDNPALTSAKKMKPSSDTSSFSTQTTKQ